MRTKTLVLTAVLSVAGAAASFAQAVYSVNAVGYVNLTFTKSGFYIVANPLNNGNNQIGTVIPNPPDSTTVFRFNNGQFGDAPTFVVNAGWFNSTGPATDVLAPGEAFFLQLPAAATYPVTLTFIGEVPQGTSITNPVTLRANAFSLLASQVPVSAGLLSTNIMQFPAADGDTVYLFDGATQQYRESFNYVAAAGTWFNSTGPTNPTPAVAEGFWLFSGATTSRTWTRSFSTQTP